MREKGFTNPHREEGRRLWYASAIGTEPLIADVILDSVRQVAGDAATAPVKPAVPAKERHFLYHVAPNAPWRIGQVVVDLAGAGFRLRHVADESTPDGDLRVLDSLAAMREIVLRDSEGNFRPLPAAPTLPRGWVMSFESGWDLMTALDYLYPAAMANATLCKSGALPVTPWRETAERQTGRFRVVREIDDAAIGELVAQHCERGCFKRRLWSPCAQAVEPAAGEIPLLCPEACNYLVGKARERIKGVGEE
jgi:sirohydrochlorin cobaltochelatase